VGSWKLDTIHDSLGREMRLAYDDKGQPQSFTKFPGRAEEQVFRFAYDDKGVLNRVEMPAAANDGPNVLTIEHQHPTDLAEGGLSRVSNQRRRIGGIDGQQTSFAWSDDADRDLVVTFPDGSTMGIGHETPQGSTRDGMNPPGAFENRITRSYNINASSHPTRSVYDPKTKFLVESCDQESDGPSGAPASPGNRCTGYVYNDDLTLRSINGRHEDGSVSTTSMTYVSAAQARGWRRSRAAG